MAIPSGSGTEVLKRNYVHGSSGSWSTVITGATNHIYTVLSVTFTEQAGNQEYIGLRVDISATGSNQIYIISDSTQIPGYGAFVWNDRIVLTGTDKLEVYSSVGNVDIYASYIDQDWS